MSDAERIPWLIVVLASPLTLAWVDVDVGAGFTLGADLFEAVTDDDLSAFYDRLYAPDGSFVGVQVAPIAVPTLASELPELEYVRRVNSDKQLQLLFTPTRAMHLDEVTDQAFGGRIYRSFAGDFALSFDTYFLEREERQAIAKAQAKWVEVKPIGS